MAERRLTTLLIDNHDSFTFNLFQYLAEINGADPIVVRNDDDREWDAIARLPFDNIVISPGPGRPEREEDFGLSARALKHAEEHGIPLLGVCLGHQGIGHRFGSQVRHAPEPMHGRPSRVLHRGEDLFAGIPSPFEAIRYHSLEVAEPLPPGLVALAWTEDRVLMALRHASLPIWGVQFHPESIGTEHGKLLLENFSRLAGRRAADASRAPAPLSPAPGSAPRLHPARARYRSRVTRLRSFPDAEALFLAEFAGSDTAFWLDSSAVRPGYSRYSYLGDGSSGGSRVLRYRARERSIEMRCAAGSTAWAGSLWDFLRSELAGARLAGEPGPFDFQGGWVGCFGYETEFGTGSEEGIPDAFFVFADRFVALDHEERAAYLVTIAPDGADPALQSDHLAWEERMQARIPGLSEPPPPAAGRRADPVRFRLRHDRASYLERIRRCFEALHDGESYELCLTNQVISEDRPDPVATYRLLRRRNPAPYGAYLRLGDLAVASSSPERFLKIDRRGVMEAKPIKGTRPRGKDAERDEALRLELAASPKDRAENLMIVDLLRNDLGTVSEIGSVHVPRLMEVESYATVHQLVSTVRGRLRPGRSSLDAIRAAFPGGSMTGAPKERTMKILEELEQGPRGLYSGALGYLGLDGAADLSIVIRTIVLGPRGVSIGAGGAIVMQSDPEAEFEEMLLKARASLETVATAVTGRPDAYQL